MVKRVNVVRGRNVGSGVRGDMSEVGEVGWAPASPLHQSLILHLL